MRDMDKCTRDTKSVIFRIVTKTVLVRREAEVDVIFYKINQPKM